MLNQNQLNHFTMYVMMILVRKTTMFSYFLT
nr:MAG TPA: hypothetical protein [Caudoviricetes sp.]